MPPFVYGLLGFRNITPAGGLDASTAAANPAVEAAYRAVGCGGSRTLNPLSCPGSQPGGAQPPPDDYTNFMDIQPDGCRSSFNRQQMSIMVTAYYVRQRLAAEGGAMRSVYPKLVVNRCLTGAGEQPGTSPAQP
jgi:hypothetical protein